MASARRTAATILGVAALAAAGGALTVGRGGRPPRAELEHAGDEIRGALEAAKAASLREIEGEVATAAAIPQLRNALVQKMDAFTLEDLFSSEDWWTPLRSRALVVTSSTGVVLTRNAPEGGFAATALLAAAAEGKPASAVVRAGRTAVVAAATRVEDVAGCALALGRAVDGHLLADWAERSHVALTLTDGRAALPAGGAPGPARAEALAGHEAEPVVVDDGGAWVAAPIALGEGTWLWGARLLPAAGGASLGAPLWAVAAAALLGALGLALSGRGAAAAAVPSPDGASAAPDPAPLAVVRRTSANLSTTIAAGEPQVFGRYTVLDRIGEGGMCEIFTAALTGPEGFQRVFVLKRLKPGIARIRAAVDQFIDEAKLGSTLVHSNIVPVFDFGKVGDGYFIAQEYIVGRNVGQIVDRHFERLSEPLDLASVVYIAHETLQALGYAHDKTDEAGAPLSIVHRDVSPGNVIVSRNGEVKLIDFGIVKAEGRVSQTDTGNVKGNAAYMAPEQARGLAVDRRADLFSLGLVMFRALSPEPFYRGGSTAEIFYSAASGPTEEHAARIDTLPEPIRPILKKALAPNPDDRYATAEDFATALAPLVPAGTKATLAQLMHSLFSGELRAPGAAGAGGTSAATSQRANGPGSR
jgi:hypothetical protein